MIGRGEGSRQPQRRRQLVSPPPTSRDFDYSPDLGQVSVMQEGMF